MCTTFEHPDVDVLSRQLACIDAHEHHDDPATVVPVAVAGRRMWWRGRA